jgi:hypothetical protein
MMYRLVLWRIALRYIRRADVTKICSPKCLGNIATKNTCFCCNAANDESAGKFVDVKKPFGLSWLQN